MAYTLRKATAEDIPGLSDVYFDGFSESLLSRQIYPADPQAAAEFWRRGKADKINDPEAHYLVVTNPARAEEIIGFAKWVAPGVPISDPAPAETWPQDGDSALAAAFFGTLAQNRRRIMGDRPHWYLSLLVVKRAWHGRKVASPLVRWGLDRADEADQVCFVDSAAEAAPVYAKFGFQTLDGFKLESQLGWIEGSFMIRHNSSSRAQAQGEQAEAK